MLWFDNIIRFSFLSKPFTHAPVQIAVKKRIKRGINGEKQQWKRKIKRKQSHQSKQI